MSEYIEREALMRNLKKFAPEQLTPLIESLVQKQPAADVVEVVRCENCKYFFDECCNHEKNRVLHRVPDFGKHYSYMGRIKVEPDHFCSYGVFEYDKYDIGGDTK